MTSLGNCIALIENLNLSRIGYIIDVCPICVNEDNVSLNGINRLFSIDRVILLLISFFFQMTGSAETNWCGAYVGGLVGLTWIDYQHYRFPKGQEPTSIIDVGIGPQFHFGYSFNSIIALEIGAAYLRKPVFKHIAGSDNNGRFKNNVAYLVTKASKRIAANVRIFFKLGVGYVVRDEIINHDQEIVASGLFVRPVYSVGVTWRFRPNWEAEFSWLGAAPQSVNQLPAGNYLGLGVQYLFF